MSQMNDMRDMLFKQMQRLSDPSNNLEKEVMRSEAMVNVAGSLIDSAKVEVAFMNVTGSMTNSTFVELGQAIDKQPKRLN